MLAHLIMLGESLYEYCSGRFVWERGVGSTDDDEMINHDRDNDENCIVTVVLPERGAAMVVEYFFILTLSNFFFGFHRWQCSDW